jgi:chloramphenicol 3-O phosphotransferase
MPENESGQIIVLNGTPRAGKSSIARAVQDSFDGVWMNVGLDRFKSMTPERFQPGIGLRPGGERPDLEPLVKTLYTAMYEAIAAHSRRGINVVADTTHHDDYSRPLGILGACARLVADLPVLFVGVHCPIESIMQRRMDTWGWGYTEDGSIAAPILRWQGATHRAWSYDLEVDTARGTAAECAELIRHRIQSGVPGTALHRLASSSCPDA